MLIYDHDPVKLVSIDEVWWEKRQSVLRDVIFRERVSLLISQIAADEEEKEKLQNFTQSIYKATLDLIEAGKKDNPLHHHVQVLENGLIYMSMNPTQYSLAEKMEIIALCICHDIGNAESTVKKTTVSTLRKARKAGTSEPEMKELIVRSILFRTDHEEKGVEITKRVLGEYLASVNSVILENVCKAIAVHDHPTIAFILKEFGNEVAVLGYGEPQEYLLPSDDYHLASIFRVLDRGFMSSIVGCEKDIVSDVLNQRSARTLQEQLLYNLSRFREERELYDEYKIDADKFLTDEYLFTDEASLDFFRAQLTEWKELLKDEALEQMAKIFSEFIR